MIGNSTVTQPKNTGGLLVAAFRAGKTEQVSWVEIDCGDLIITVASDAMKATLNGRAGVRLPVSYNEAVELCREMGCISPTKEMADAMFAKASAQLNCVPLVQTAADSTKMMTVDFSLRFHDGVEKQLGAAKATPGALVFGAWKLWIAHPRLAERGAVNYGFWDKSKKPPAPIQTVGGRHDAAHYDYSQVFQPVKRMAREKATGKEIDLVDYLANKVKIPEKYVEPYRLPPGSVIESFAEPEATNLADVLSAAGVNVNARPGWEKAGRPNFTPVGIMLHHTAGPKNGDAPTLNVCVNGRPDLPGPLCHIVLARSGIAHVIAGGRANHAGDGAQQVLDRVKKDDPVIGNAVTNKYADVKGLSGNGYFYGIEVENTGVGEAYSDAQVNALAKICAAICQWKGWSSNRVIHHRQWTARKCDMSLKVDMPALVAQMMDTGTAHFGVSFCEEEEAPFPPDVLAGSPQEDRDEP